MLSTEVHERAVRTVLAIRCRHDAQPGAVIQWYERRTIEAHATPATWGHQHHRQGTAMVPCPVDTTDRRHGTAKALSETASTTTPSQKLPTCRWADLLDRHFQAAAPNPLWDAVVERHEASPSRAVVKGLSMSSTDPTSQESRPGMRPLPWRCADSDMGAAAPT